MQTLHYEVDRSLEALASRDPRALQRLVTDQAAELGLLRQRLATLEAVLASSQVPRAQAPAQVYSAPPLEVVDPGFAPRHHVAFASQFAPSNVPAVVPASRQALSAANPATPVADAAKQLVELESCDRGAEAWASPDVTFEERIAAKAFFGHGSVDEESRTWLLGSAESR